MVLTDARQVDCPIVLANHAFLELTGYAADEVVGRNCRFLQGSGTCPQAIATLRAAVGEGRSVDVEILNYRKDGTEFWNELHVSPICDEDGNLAYFFASQIDVTTRRRVEKLEASERRLLKEVDHRAKNVLAIVDSIVRLSNADDPAAYASAVQHRVQSLAQAHIVLAHARWQEVDLRALIDAQISAYATDAIKLEGRTLYVRSDMLQPLSLAVHELLMNAVIHGCLSAHATGELSIEWTGGADGFTLIWLESGGIPKPDENVRGFGTMAVTALVEKQLGGRITRDWSDGCFRIVIDVPHLA